MAASFGATTLPVAEPGTGSPTVSAPASDPLLETLGSYLRAVVNAQLGAVWAALCPGKDSLPIKAVFYHDPNETEFNERDLPALYVVRTSAGRNEEWIAEDILQDHSSIVCLWVAPVVGNQRDRARRFPITNGLVKAVTSAIETGRHPAWYVANDPDPDARQWGSVFYRHAHVDGIRVGKYQRQQFSLPMANGERRYYDEIAIPIEVDEALTEDVAAYPLAESLHQTITTPDGAVIDDAVID